jgi:ribosomal protein S18 acetylase RimI-like enzyme
VSITISIPVSLDAATVASARALIDACNQAEGLDLPIAPIVEEGSGLLLAHAGDELVGIAHVGFGAEAEACLCVAPAWRRRGAGRALVAEVAALSTGQGAAELILVSDMESASGQAFVAALGARRSYAEHRLDYDFAAAPPAPAPLPGLHIRLAGPADAAIITAILVAAFGDAPAMVASFVARRIADPDHRFFLGELDGHPVGTLRLVVDDGWPYITTFGVLPELHGRGVGRRMLLHTVELLRAEGHGRIRIEVVTTNTRALGLYKSCGFRQGHTFTYDALPL